MRSCVITFSGMQPTAALECQEIIAVDSSQNEFGITFVSSPNKIARLAYHSQCAVRVIVEPCFFSSENLDSAQASFSKEFSSPKEIKFKSFKIDCDRFGTHDFVSKDFCAKAAEVISQRTGAKVDLGQPDVVFYALIRQGKAVFGLDICGFDLSKRYYKVFSSPSSLRGPIGYYIARNSDAKKVFLDPQCSSGIVPIELAIWCSGRSLHQYQFDSLNFTRMEVFKDGLEEALKPRPHNDLSIYAYDPFMPNVYASKKNAKIAGIQKLIHFGRIDFEWMDIKFDEKEVDAVSINLAKADKKAYETLFYQLDFIMSKNSSVVVTGNFQDEVAQKYGFIKEKDSVLSWNSGIRVSCFRRTANL